MALHLNYDMKNKNGIIFNDKYQGAMYRGEEYRPDLAFPYEEFGYSEVFDLVNFVVLDGTKRVMTTGQELDVQRAAREWVQPLGQEGNPNDEQKLAAIKGAIQAHLDATAVRLGYDNINTISKFMGFDNPFRTTAEALALYCANTWIYVESELVKMADNGRSIPTNEEAVAELPTFVVPS